MLNILLNFNVYNIVNVLLIMFIMKYIYTSCIILYYLYYTYLYILIYLYILYIINSNILQNDTTLQNCLVPNLIGLLPYDNAKDELYESGCLFLIKLQNILGTTTSKFVTFLQSYLIKFAYKSVKTDDWVTYLYQYFPRSKVTYIFN